jgi:signal transduction histidine kinase
VSRRLLVTYLALALAILAALQIPLGITYARTERRDLTARVEHDALAMASISEETLERGSAQAPPGMERVAARYTRDIGGRVVVVDATGLSILDTGRGSTVGRDFSTRPEFAAALAGRTASGQRHSDTLGTDLIYVAVPVASGGRIRGAVRVTYPSSALADRVRRYWLLLAAIAGVVLAAVALVGVRFSRTLTGPLSRLEVAAAAASEGDLTARAPTDAGPPEIRALSRQFNEMVERLEVLLQSQREFVADASHQLRTPLTALRLRLENLGRRAAGQERANADAAQAEVERLSGLVDDLLALARADATQPKPVPTDISATVHRRLEVWTPQAAESKIALVADVSPGLIALATPASLDQVLDNLIENAIAASTSGQTVTVRARGSGSTTTIAVMDEGSGLSQTDRERAFDRFWRGGARRPGSGLGLPIARRLTEADGGTLVLTDGEGGGLDAVIRLRST